MPRDANGMGGDGKFPVDWKKQGVVREGSSSLSELAAAGVLASLWEMSRRSRRRGNTGGVGWLGKAALGLIVVGVLSAGILYAMVRSYLHSEDFRQLLSEKVGAAAQLSGEFTPFRWEGLAVDTSAFAGRGEGPVKELRVEGLHTEVGLSGLRRGVWSIIGTQAQRIEISLDARNSQGVTPAPGIIQTEASPQREKESGWLPTEIEVDGVNVREVVVRATLNQGPASVTGMKIHVEPAAGKHAYLAELADGAIVLPFDFLPTIRLDRARLRYQDGLLSLNSANASAWQDGRLEATGEWDSRQGTYSIQGHASDVKCEELLNETWAKRVTGTVDSDFTLGNGDRGPTAKGRLTIRNGTLTALPVLDALAAYADTRRFRVLTLSEAHTDWRWQDGEILLSNLVLASEGLVRLEGRITIRDRKLDGFFRLGLAPGTLASIPGAETDVFLPGERGLVWAPLRISGTADDPKEDLTGRLIAAAGLRMFDIIPGTGEKVIKYSSSLLGESPSKTIDKGIKIIEEGTGILGEATGILDGILGGGRRKIPEEKKTEP